MASASFEGRLQFEQLLFLGAMILGVIFLGFFMASNLFLVFLLVGLTLWLFNLPYHSYLSIILATSTFTSALLVPFFPGRPFLWEFSALLAWSGLVVTIFMRRYEPGFMKVISSNRLVFIGIAGYCLVLVFTMFYRGFGLRILGSQMVGGRFYFQQLACAIFPLLFVICRLNPQTLVRLFVIQCILTLTYVVSDLAFSYQKATFLLRFLEVPGDAVNFEVQSLNFGIRRFQSLNFVGISLFMVLLIWRPLKDFFTSRGAYLIPVALGIISVGLLSGHRYLILITGITGIVNGFSQKLFNLRNTIILSFAILLSLSFTYAFAKDLPLAAQRAISFLPAIPVTTVAKSDGQNTIETRRILFRIGLSIIPEYFWIGQGFGRVEDLYANFYDPNFATAHVNQGVFYNGFIGLMVNTGVFGTLFFLIFAIGGSLIAFRLIRLIRYQPCNTYFLRLCSVLSGLWIANLIAFFFFHGDSEFAIKSFALQSGLLIACEQHWWNLYGNSNSRSVAES